MKKVITFRISDEMHKAFLEWKKTHKILNISEMLRDYFGDMIGFTNDTNDTNGKNEPAGSNQN